MRAPCCLCVRAYDPNSTLESDERLSRKLRNWGSQQRLSLNFLQSEITTWKRWMFHFHRMVNANTRKNIANKRMFEKITSTANLLYQIYTHTHTHTHTHKRRLRKLTVCQPVCVNKTSNKTISLYTTRVLVGKPEGKRPLGRPRRKWKDNIKMDLQEVGREGMDWIDVTQDRDRWRALVNAVKILRVP